MTTHTLRLAIDSLSTNESFALPAMWRALYMAADSAIVRGERHAAFLEANSAWCGASALAVAAGKVGMRCLRFEFGPGEPPLVAPGGVGLSRMMLSTRIALPATEVLLRCDRVDFPPGGEALTHVHQGPGIRCLIAGSIRIDSGGQSHHYGVGEAWFESGPEPVYAAASATEPTAFVRVMILPRALLGKSSIRYVRPEDADRPKSQKYQVFADEPIDP